MNTITTTIKREWLREIIAGRKTVEHRVIKPYWDRQLARVETPFQIRLINGMAAKAPAVTAVVRRVRKNTRTGNYDLHLGEILKVKNWDRRGERPRS